MTIAPGTHRLGPESASLQVRPYREGAAARVGHDLVLHFTRWEATVEIAPDPAGSSIELTADPRSLEVREGWCAARGFLREGLHGVKPLTERDRAEIRRNIDDKVLRGRPIAFRS